MEQLSLILYSTTKPMVMQNNVDVEEGNIDVQEDNIYAVD